MSRDAVLAAQDGYGPATSTAENYWRKTDMVVADRYPRTDTEGDHFFEGQC
jgi:hypothetical protein